MLREAFGQLDLEAGPNVLFAYTLKGWMLPSVGDPQNHSVNLTREQMEELREVTDGKVPIFLKLGAGRVTDDVKLAAKAGADISTVPLAVLMQMMKHPLTDVGQSRFLQDWQRASS